MELSQSRFDSFVNFVDDVSMKQDRFAGAALHRFDLPTLQ